MTRRTQRDEVLVAPEIPLDLQIEIVNRLPIKSLARFKCVSKLWSSLILSQGYLFASPPRLLYISLVQDSVMSIKVKSVLLSLTSASKSTAFELDLTMNGIGGYHHMVTLRGLILYKFGAQACIYNPTTRQRIVLPAPNIFLAKEEYTAQLDYNIGYDPVLDQYKVLCSVLVRSRSVTPVSTSAHHLVFLLDARSSWKRIECGHHHFPTGRVLCINGVIYFFDMNYASGINFMSFDIRSEKFSMIQLPHAVPKNLNFVWLIEYGGKPTIFDSKHLRDPSGLLNLWVLEEIGKWSKKSLDLHNTHFFPSSIYFQVMGTTQNGEVVLKPCRMSSPYYILYYDVHKNYVRRVDIPGIWEDPIHLSLMDTGESIKHFKI